MDLARQKKITINSPVIDIILEGGDVLKRFTTEIDQQLSGAKPAAPISILTADLIGRVRKLISGGTIQASKPAVQETPVQPPASAPVGQTAPAAVAPETQPAAQQIAGKAEHGQSQRICKNAG